MSYLDLIDATNARLLHDAWRLAATSMGSVYYSLPVPDGELPGDRPWPPRWEQLEGAFDFRGRRVLELGSNLGLLSIFALLAGAEAATACDRDAVVLRAGQITASCFGVFPAFVHCDLTHSDDWETRLLRHEPDVACLLNVFHWVEDKQRLIRFLAHFDELITEEHDSAGAARRRLRAAGFENVSVVAESEIGRPILVARRTGGRTGGSRRGAQS